MIEGEHLNEISKNKKILFMPISIIPHDTNIDFMGKRWIAFSLSIFLMIASITVCAVRGFNLGIDFTGGILIEAKFSKTPDLGELREVFSKAEVGDVSLQNLGNTNNIMIRIGEKSHQTNDQAKLIERIKTILKDKYNNEIEYRKIDYVGPKVGSELIKAGIWSLIIALGAMMAYIWFRFEWYYGLGGILALIHDAVLTLAFYSITRLDFNLSSIAAILTVVGYSINDSVVIFDRIRDDIRKYKKMPLDQLINNSLNKTLSRTIMVSLSVILALVALVFLGGKVTLSFSLAALFGTIVGTYSSIYVGTPILVYLRLRSSEDANNK